MRIDILTLFPDMCDTVLHESIIGRAVKKGILEVHCHNIRDYTTNRQNQVDDYPYGGGAGMILQPQPICDCFDAVAAQCGARPYLVFLSPQGRRFTQDDALRLSKLPNLALLCGHYEGVDQRVVDLLVDEELSVGDFILTGGELPALMVADATARLVPGVLAGEESWRGESFASGLLEYPQYSRPAEYHGAKVPDVLLSGHHANIEKWRRSQALRRTLLHRPDLLKTAPLTDWDRAELARLRQELARQPEKSAPADAAATCQPAETRQPAADPPGAAPQTPAGPDAAETGASNAGGPGPGAETAG